MQLTCYLRTSNLKRFLTKRVLPTKMTICENVEKYRTEGSSLNLNRVRSGCRRTKRTQENVNIFQEKIIEDPKKSTRKYDLDISKNIFNRNTKRDFKWYPYKMQV